MWTTFDSPNDDEEKTVDDIPQSSNEIASISMHSKEEPVQSKANPTYCSHCSVPFSNNDPTTSHASLTKALFIIFKLNYLKAVDRCVAEDEALLFWCPTCSDILSNLYRIYNDFVELGKINSYLSRKLDRMNEIVDCHEERSISCDLISEIKFSIDDCSPASLDDDDPSSFLFSNRNVDAQSNSTVGNNNNLIVFDREPRIILTRLSGKFSQSARPSNSSVKAAASENNKIRSIIIHDSVDHDSDFVLPDEDEDMDDYERSFIQTEDEDFQEARHHLDTMDPIVKSSSCQQLRNKKTTTMHVPNRRIRSSSSKLEVEGLSTSTTTTTKNKKWKDEKLATTTTTSNLKRKYSKAKGKYSKTSNQNKYSRLASSKRRRKTKNQEDDDDVNSNKLKTEKVVIRSCEIIPKNSYYYAKRILHPNPCWYCKRKDFLTPQDCLKHTKKEHLPICLDHTFVKVCERCSRICLSKSGWSAHVKRCALIPPGECLPRTIPCTQCSKSFGSMHRLKLHEQHHLNDRPFPCDECSYRGKSAYRLKSHKQNKHQLETSEQQLLSRVQCNLCEKFLKNQICLKWHINHQHTVEGNKKYKEYMKRDQALKKEKTRQRAVERSTVCADCEVDFYSRQAYLNHRRNFHADIQGKFVCDKCGRVFSTMKILKCHEKTHTDEKPFLCQECGKGYTTAKVLNTHYKNTHTTEGRLKYNEKTRERHRRRKLLQKLLAEKQLHNHSPSTIEQDNNKQSGE